MSLAGKIVCSVALPVLLLAWATWLNLRALEHASAESRHALARIGPAVHQADEVGDALEALARLQTRWSTLDEPAYGVAWEARLARLEASVAVFRTTLESVWEAKLGDEAAHAIARYRALSSTTTDGSVELRALTIAERRRAGHATARARRAFDDLVTGLTAAARRMDANAAIVAARAWDATVAGASLAALLAILLSSLIGWRIVRGLGRLTDASVALERGRLDQPVAIVGGDELARLATAFESLATGLQERDRISEQTLLRVGRDLAEPLMRVRDAAALLAADVPERLDSPECRLIASIAQATDELLRRIAGMGDATPRSLLPPAEPRALEAPARRLLVVHRSSEAS